MNTIKTILTGVAIASLTTLMAMPAMAMNHKDAVIDKNGKHVVDSNGNCVRTKWDMGNDVCGGAMVMNVIDDRIIYFGFDKSSLTAKEQAKLDRLAKTLEHHNVKDVKIVGYTDRLGGNEYNHKLSHKRAETVQGYLNSKVKLDSSVVEVRGLGESHQVKMCDGMKGKELISCLAPNRRVEVESEYLGMLK